MPTTLARPSAPQVPDVVDVTTRREILIGAGAALLLGACGTSGRTDAVQSTAADDTEPIINTVSHKYGSTEVPADPQRVVTVGLVDHDAVLALGTVPVGITATEFSGDQRSGVWPWAHDRLGDARPEVLPNAEVNAERIAALRPDLILAVYSGITQQEYRTLSQIAPTVAQSGEHPDYQTPWDTMTRTIGSALGKEEAAESLIAEVEKRFADARQRHPEFAGLAFISVLSLPFVLDGLVPQLAAAIDGDAATTP